MKVKKRLDVLLVERGLSENRTKAQAVIMSGLVDVNGQRADKPGVSYEETVDIQIRGAACPYVSRGGLKLEKALRDFGVHPVDYVCSDSGASTGGFTDCLLQQGAKKVFAIDVGYGQLDWKIRNDPRVVVMERTNIRYVKAEDLFQQGDTDSRQQVQDAHCALAFVLRIGGGDDTHGAFAFRVLSLFLRVGAFDVLQQQVGDPLRLRGFVRQAHFVDLRRAFLVLSTLAVHPDG